MRRDSEQNLAINAVATAIGVVGALFVGIIYWRLFNAQHTAIPVGNNQETAAPTPTSIPETVLWRPIPRGFNLATSVPRIVAIEALECQGLVQAPTDADQGAFIRRGPGLEFPVAGTISAGEPVRLREIVRVTYSDGEESFWNLVITNVPPQISRDGQVTSYARIALPNTNEQGLGVNVNPKDICKPISGKH